MNKLLLAVAPAAAPTLAGLPAASAQNVPGHPRLDEVNQRLLNQQHRIEAGFNQGQIGAQGEARDQAPNARVARQPNWNSRTYAQRHHRIDGPRS